MAERITKEQRSEIMSRIKSADTGLERIFRKILTKNKINGFRRKSKLLGKPDFISIKDKIVIFVDGDFWHGYNWKRLGKIPPMEYWQGKIKRTIARDKKHNQLLKSKGWKVLRFWEHEIKNKPEKVVNTVLFWKKVKKARAEKEEAYTSLDNL